ncbi:MAG: LuxR C-terminal-related transcriptional regulator [Pseudomonadota bacterium]|nr:LuxR C-terminal-related transcriptional regulator [Pseudomonadota bacterium]
MATLAEQLGDYALPDSIHSRVARLSKGQRQCLALVDQHLSSKEIALKLGISSHTVDQRVRQSLHPRGGKAWRSGKIGRRDEAVER